MLILWCPLNEVYISKVSCFRKFRNKYYLNIIWAIVKNKNWWCRGGWTMKTYNLFLKFVLTLVLKIFIFYIYSNFIIKYYNYKCSWASAYRVCSRYPTGTVHPRTLSKYDTLNSFIVHRRSCKYQLLSNYDQENKISCPSSPLPSNPGASWRQLCRH